MCSRDTRERGGTITEATGDQNKQTRKPTAKTGLNQFFSSQRRKSQKPIKRFQNDLKFGGGA